MNKQPRKRLELGRITIRILDVELERALGGKPTYRDGCSTSCTCTGSCHPCVP